MEPTVPTKKLEPGIYQGTPETSDAKKVPPVRLIRTMKSDAVLAIKNQKETSVSIAIAEQKKVAAAQVTAGATTQETNTPPAPKPIGRVVVIAIIAIIIAMLGLAYVFVLPKLGAIKLPSVSIPSFGKASDTAPATTTEAVVSLAPSLVPADSEKRFDITSQTQAQIFADIKTEAQNSLSSGLIKNLYFTEGSTAISANRLFIFAGLSAPEILVRSLERPFMTGFFGSEGGVSVPFVILKVSSSDSGLAGMLEWEATLPRAFDTFFGTSVEGGVMSTTKFRDTVTGGKDTRVLSTNFGGSISYVFANPNTIVVAGSTAVLEALIPLAGKN